ncbi:MAG: hypothetical protein ACK50Q_12690 [Labrys sp. (in: a-proteobacteria)]
MASSQVDVNRILSFRLKDVLRGNTFAGLLFAALGAFVLIVPPADQRDWEGVLAGTVVLAVGLSILIVPRLKVQRNEQIVAEFSPAGVMMGIQNSTRQRFLVPWDEVIEITQISFTRRIVTTFATYFREPAITVSRDFFDREIDVEVKGRGPFWDHHVHMLPRDEGVRLALLHNEFNMSRRQLRAEIEERWRAFSTHPGAKRPAAAERDPLSVIDRLWDSATATAGGSIAVKAVAILIGILVVYFSHYILAYVGMAKLNEAQIRVYAGDLLKAGNLPGSIDDGPITMLTPALISSVTSGSCEPSIRRDLANSGFLPRYMEHHACRAALVTADRRPAKAVFDLIVVEYEQVLGVDATTGVEKLGTYRALTAVTPPPDDVRLRLCADGGC